MKKDLQFVFFVVGVFLFSFLNNVYPQDLIIWYIDKINSNDPSYQQKSVIEYQVRDDPNCEAFPSKLYSEFAKDNNPQEIWINSNYTKDLDNPILSIEATTIESQNIKLFIYKGENFSIGEKKMLNWGIYNIPIGYIKKGLHDKNRIIITIKSSSDVPIVFDSLWLSQNLKDADGDGVSDSDEGDEEGYKEDKATAAIPIRSYNPNEIQRIILHVKESEESSPYFKEARFLDANTFSLSEKFISSLYFPYGFLGFRVEGFEPHERVVLQIGFEDKLYPSVRFYTYQDTNEWEEINFNIIDANSVDITLSDCGKGDFDGQKDSTIHTKLFLAYPHGLGVHIEKTGCFIEGILSRGKIFNEDLF